MKKALNSLLLGCIVFILGLCFVTIPGCKKEDAPAPSGGGSTSNYGNVMVWTKNSTLGTVTVICDGQTQTITKYSPSGSPTECGVTGFANFSLPAGTYKLTASNNTGVSWNGSITVKANDCTTQELTYSGSGGNGGTGGGGTGGSNAMFWTQNSNLGNITVVCEGQSQTISKYSTSGSPGACGTTGFASFTLAAGTHNFTASSVSGVTWSGNINVTTNGCFPMELTYSGSGGSGGTGGGGGSTTGNLIVWTNADQGGGPISVTVNGQFGSITQVYSSNTQTNFPACGSGGCANFTLAPGTYAVQASDGAGNSWTGQTVSVSANNCSSTLLQ